MAEITYPQLWGSPWIFTYPGAPMADVPTDPDNIAYISAYSLWIDTTTSDWWICIDSGDGVNNGLSWQFLFTQPGLKAYTNQSSLGFNASRQPSQIKDTQLAVGVTLTNTLLTTSTVEVQISPDNVTFETIAPMANLTQAVNSNTYFANPIIPAGYYYRLLTSGSGTHTLVVLKELPL